MMKCGPIGVFDSGVGGFSVINALRRVLPFAPLFSIADQAHVPYGGRPLEEINSFALGMTLYLVEKGCSVVVMACNISSAVALDEAREAFPELPIIGVIEPGAALAIQTTKNLRIGVLATVGTVRSGAYTHALRRVQPQAETFEVACPNLVPLIEKGDTAGSQAEKEVRAVTEPLLKAEVDTIVLGCTHYPFLADVIQKITGPFISLVDPAEAVAKEVALRLEDCEEGWRTYPTKLVYCTTGDLAHFQRQTRRFCMGAEGEFKVLRWERGKLIDSPQFIKVPSSEC